MKKTGKQILLEAKAEAMKWLDSRAYRCVNDGGKCSPLEYLLILNEMYDKSLRNTRLHMLVFGAGLDSQMWADALSYLSENIGLSTNNIHLCIVENSKKYLDMVPDFHKGFYIDKIFYEYGTKKLPMDADEYINNGPNRSRWPVKIPEIYEQQWDIIFVDGPCGKRPNTIATAARIWGNQMRRPSIFIHDSDRVNERKYINYLFREDTMNLVQIDRMEVIKEIPK